MKPARFDYHRPQELAAALALLAAHPEAKALAGGQSLGPMLNLRLARPGLLVDLGRLDELRQIADEGSHLRIGAMVTHATLEDHPIAGAEILAEVAPKIAYRAIRTRGTIGGSIAHADPAADWLTLLTALDAEALIDGPRGPRRLPLGAFVLGAFTTALEPEELLVALRIAKLSPSARWGYWKVWRRTGELAEALAAVVVDPERGVRRVVLGALGGPPVSLDDLAEALAAGEITDDAVRASVRRAAPHLDPLDRQIHVAAVRRALQQVLAP